jgi:transposase-like protein
MRDRFSTEEACRSYLVELRWPNGIICPACGSKEIWIKKPPLNRCASCRHDFSVTAGSLLADTHKPLRLWFEAIWNVTNQKSGASALGLQRTLGLGSYRTAWNWLHKLRRAMVRPGRDRLHGVVEVDEAFIGGSRPGKRGRGAAGKSLVLVAAEADGKKIGRIRMVRIADASAANLLPRINLTISLLKRWLLGSHQGSARPEHLDTISTSSRSGSTGAPQPFAACSFIACCSRP